MSRGLGDVYKRQTNMFLKNMKLFQQILSLKTTFKLLKRV
ncbi:hypothetical protein JMUB7529_28280 [Staphylococcus aureus]